MGQNDNKYPDEKNYSDKEAAKEASKNRASSRQKENSLVRKIVTFVILALVVILIVLGFSFYKFWQDGLKPLDPDNKKVVQIEIPIGTSNKGIGAILEKEKIIKSGLVFSYYVKTNNITDFKGGYYQMSPNMKLSDISSLLKQGGSEEPSKLADARLTIPEGSSIKQIAKLVSDNTDIKKDEFLKLMKDDAFFNELYEQYPKLLESVKDAKDVRYRLEGYLFPATYNYYKKNDLKDFVSQMVGKTNDVIEAREADLVASHLTTQEMLTLASLVEKEGVEEGDRRKIAQVFLNRIKEKMPLQSDISILYAMDEHKVHLSIKDTQVDSPYNLYVNTGFGPGPFNNPSEQAIDAVLNPEKNDYLYFLADVSTHKVYFAKTYDEHLVLKEKYIDSKE
ncbi:endolytic transglycosylase MltG [Vagococcus intermedius]|uniref:Endolytic murein transglycosylase n=1 Tax=Vagococcus intermedius TaxID=2991418 RepID=A0AAF0CU14_9ENTE|nr:endolytic transglycosylase MltG [Vagococcus intermedius]WEG72908.1 endolytic transglycosylase MltG [Vagococcus intermedius]WEG74995.1 endolytic transglycosylase MltG [Vagococcus intermedius]